MYVALFDVEHYYAPDLKGFPAQSASRWRPNREIPTAVNYSRQPVTLDASGLNTATVTMGGPQSTPAFASPSEGPNAWVLQLAALCTGGTAGVADVVAAALIGMPKTVFGDIAMILPGESVSFAPGSLRYQGGMLSATAGLSPTRMYDVAALLPGGAPNPCYGACFLKRYRAWHVQWATWSNAHNPATTAEGLGFRNDMIDIAAAQLQADVAAAQASTCGCV